MIDYLYAELTDNVPNLDYEGKTTTTAKVLIDDEERSISVDVLKLPHSITFNNEVFDGSEDKVFTVDLSNYYTKDEIYNKNETYNKEEIDALVSEKEVVFDNVEFSGATLPKATLNVSEEEFGLIVGQDDVNVVLNLASGDTLILHRESYDGDGARFICSVGHINTEFTMTLYFATFVKVGNNIVGEVYEIDAFESNVEIPSGVEPVKLTTAKIFGKYFEVGSGIEATVDEENKTINIVLE